MASRVLLMPRRRARVLPMRRPLCGYALFDTANYQAPDPGQIVPSYSMGQPNTAGQQLFMGPPQMQSGSTAPNFEGGPTLAPIVNVSPLPGVQQVPNASAAVPAGTTIVATPTSGAIPPPAAVQASATPWLEQQMIAGLPNKWLLLGGAAALLLFGGKR